MALEDLHPQVVERLRLLRDLAFLGQPLHLLLHHLVRLLEGQVQHGHELAQRRLQEVQPVQENAHTLLVEARQAELGDVEILADLLLVDLPKGLERFLVQALEMVGLDFLPDLPGLLDAALLNLKADVPGGLGGPKKNVRKGVQALERGVGHGRLAHHGSEGLPHPHRRFQRLQRPAARPFLPGRPCRRFRRSGRRLQHRRPEIRARLHPVVEKSHARGRSLLILVHGKPREPVKPLMVPKESSFAGRV